MYQMPPEDALKFYQVLSEIPFSHASCPTFWGALTLRAINLNLIKSPVWLCIDRDGKEEEAKKRIDAALDRSRKSDWNNKKQTKSGNNIDIDGLTRRALRWLMGPMKIRGTPTLYSNCSLAKAWWCGWFASRCVKKNKLYGVDTDIESATHSLNLIWAPLVEYMAGKLPILREETVVYSIMMWNLKYNRKNEEAKTLFKKLGAVSESRAIGLLNPKEIKKEFIDIE